MQRDSHRAVGPIEMGIALIEALGLKGVPGILKLQINAEAGELPTLTVVRSITVGQAGAVCALLKEWKCDLVPTQPATERQVRADGSVGEATPEPFCGSHPGKAFGASMAEVASAAAQLAQSSAARAATSSLAAAQAFPLE